MTSAARRAATRAATRASSAAAECCAARAGEKAFPDKASLRAAWGVERDACFWRHAVCETPWPGCGHARCSEQPEEGGCPQCAATAETSREEQRVAADRERAQAMADDAATSASLKAVLRRWCADPGFMERDAAQVVQQALKSQKRHRW